MGQCGVHAANRGRGSLAFDSKVNCGLRHVRVGVVATRSWILIAHIEPAIFCASRVRTKDAKFDTLRLGKSPVLTNLGQALADGRVIWIIDVDVSAGARVRGLHNFVTVTFLLLLEGNLNCLFLQETRLDVVTLFLVHRILSRTRIAQVGLLCEGSVELILPKVASLCRAHEWIDVLAAASCADSKL